MSFRLEKNMRILDELVGFCCKRGAKDVNMNISLGDNATFITITSYVKGVTKEDLDNLNEVLHSDRQHEIEESYWLVGGDNSFGDELTLTGIMIDDASVEYDGEQLKIVARRIED